MSCEGGGGGLAGWSGGNITQCHASVVVSGIIVGGLVGFNVGNITECLTSGKVWGATVGGLVGGNAGNITECLASGKLSGQGSVGGLVGQTVETGKITESYWDIQTTGQQASAGGGLGKTTDEMKRQDTFAGWNFEQTWQMEEGKDYPALRCFAARVTAESFDKYLPRTSANSDKTTPNQPSSAPALTVGQTVIGISPDLNAPNITRPIEALASLVTIASPGTYQFSRNDATKALAEDIGTLHRQYPCSPELHYAYAVALQLNLMGETANKVMAECAKAHPTFWIADLTMRRNSLFTWNPLTCPQFAPVVGNAVHDSINRILSKALLLTTRRGIIPRAVVFQRDDGFDTSALPSCKMDFITTVSPVRDPQVIAINACIWDNPSDPYRTEVLACPFEKRDSETRFRYELFARQKDFDFVIVDRAGRIKYTRSITPSNRMKAVNDQLARMFDTSEGREIPESMFMGALRQHTTMVNPNTIIY